MALGESEFRVEVKDTVLAWAGWERTLDIRAVGVKLLRADGEVIASAPAVAIEFSVAALLQGKLAPTTVEVLGAQLKGSRSADGTWSIGFHSDDKEETSAEQASGIAKFLGDALSEPAGSGSPAAHLRRIAVLDAGVAIDDQKSGTIWWAPHADLVIFRENGTLQGNLSASVDTGGVITDLDVIGELDADNRKLALTFNVKGLNPSLLAAKVPELADLSGFHGELAGAIETTMDLPTRTLSDVSFDIAAGPVHIDVPQYKIDDLALEQVLAKGTVVPDLSVLRLDDLFIDAGGPVGEFEGLVTLEDGKPAIKLTGGFNKLPVNDLPRFWPPQFAQDARRWITSNIRGGRIDNAKIVMNLPAKALATNSLPAKAIVLDFDFAGLRVDYLHPMTRLTDAAGKARLTNRDFRLTLDKADVGNLRVSEGTLYINDLHKKDQFAEIGAVVSGHTADGLALVDEEPLKLASKLDLQPRSVAGNAATRLKINFPLEKDLKPEEVDVIAAANLRGASKPNLVADYDLSDGDLLLKVDKDRMTVEGVAAINGVPMNVFWGEEFGDDVEIRSRYRLSGMLDDKGRQAFGLTTGDYLAGPVGFSADIDARSDGKVEGAVSVRLDKAALNFDELKWHKPVGEPGQAVVHLETGEGDELRISRFDVSTDAFSATGQATLRGGALGSLDIARVKFGGNDFSAAIRVRAGGGYIIALEGTSFDLTPYIDDFIHGDTGPTPPLELSARVAKVRASKTLVLTGVDAKASFNGSQWTAIDAEGAIDGKASMHAVLQTRGGKRYVDITSPDAGELGRATDLFTNGQGGTLSVKAQIRDDLQGQPVTGRLEVDNFKVVNAPTLARILTLGSLTGIVNLLNGEGITFTQTVVPFKWEDKTLELREARAVGTIGITLEGVVDTKEDKVDLNGTLVPARTLNAVLEKIPIIGQVLVGKKGEGVFAVTYGVNGPVENPKIVVNPASMLAPGILRRMFTSGQGQDQGATPPDDEDVFGVGNK